MIENALKIPGWMNPDELEWLAEQAAGRKTNWRCNQCFYFGWGSKPCDFWTTVKDWLGDI